MCKEMFMEVLSPAGSKESLIAAVEAGCNAVYLGGQSFSARSSAANFSNEELEETIDYCHLRGVKVYIAVNTLYKNRELKEVVNFITNVVNFGADAIIVQDLGIGNFIKENFSQIPIYGSTQMTVHDVEGAIFLKKQGFSRVVLSRELSLEEIKKIAQSVDIEVEIFVHGALCVCYSGQCLMSSMIGQRSGNRGSCAQPCRLKYDFYEKDLLIEKGYLMSPKDLMGLEFISEIWETGAKSLKIEGRMKKPEYVFAVTRAYCDGVNNIKNGKVQIPKETIKQVTQVFNRGGDFTDGYFKNYSGKKMMSIETPKNTGIFVGKVRYYNPKTKMCTIEIKESLHPGDGIEIWTKTLPHAGTNINKDFIAPSVIEIKIDSEIEKGNLVYKSFDKKMMDNIKGNFSRNIRKMTVQCNVYARISKELSIELKKDNLEVALKGEIVEKAVNQPLDREKLLLQIGKSGTTPFRFEFNECNIDGDIYIGVKQINQLRREVSNLFAEKYVNSFKSNLKPKEILIRTTQEPTKRNISVSVYNREQFLSALKFGISHVYIECCTNFLENIEEYVLLGKKQNIKIFAALPHICKDNEYSRKIIRLLENSSIDGYLIRTFGQLNLLEKSTKIKVTDYSFNIFNSFSTEFLLEKVDNITLSVELTLEEINESGGLGCEVIIHGRQVLMVTNQCPIGNYAGNKGSQKYCSLKNKKANYYLKDRKNVCFPIITDCENCQSFVLNSKKLFTLNKINDIKNIKAEYIRLSFTDESHVEVETFIQAYLEQLTTETIHCITEEMIEKFVKDGITNGHFYRGCF